MNYQVHMVPKAENMSGKKVFPDMAAVLSPAAMSDTPSEVSSKGLSVTEGKSFLSWANISVSKKSFQWR